MEDSRNHHEKRKEARNAGLSYTSTGGKLVEAKKVGPECRCNIKNCQKIPQSTREAIFEAFYSLKEYSDQNGYLFGLIKVIDPKKAKEPQKLKYNYSVRVEGKEISVCRKEFANIHAISFKRMRILCEKLVNGQLIPTDSRGKHENRPRNLDPKWEPLIREHIAGIIRNDGLINQYLKKDGYGINLSQMLKDFVKKHENERVKRWFYNQTYNQMIKEKEFYPARKRLEKLNADQGSENHKWKIGKSKFATASVASVTPLQDPKRFLNVFNVESDRDARSMILAKSAPVAIMSSDIGGSASGVGDSVHPYSYGLKIHKYIQQEFVKRETDGGSKH